MVVLDGHDWFRIGNGYWVRFKLISSVKMVGLFTVGTVGIATLFDLWKLLDIKRGLSIVFHLLKSANIWCSFWS
jgi:dolichyl-phosphate-mannose--protein O-mannosyl transferase